VSYLTINQVKEITQLSTATIYRLMAQGKFPKQIKLSERTSRWISSELEEFIDQKIEERNSKYYYPGLTIRSK
jgi:prophage regulatory protein